jgi:N-methylhydantoinase B
VSLAERERTVIPEAVGQDPITMEVLRDGFRAVCNESSALLARVAYAATITEGHDFSGSLLSADGRLVSHGQKDQAAHLGTFEASLAAVLDAFPESAPGEGYVLNDPYLGGSHTPDIKVVRPIFAGGRLIAHAISCGHWPDVGGPVPGTFNPQATECYAEGIRIPPMRLLEAGEPVASTLALIRANVRNPDERMADLHAQIQATRLVADRLEEYAGEFGVETVLASMEVSIARSRALLGKAIGELPDGTYEFTDYGDRDYMHPDRPRIKVHLELRIEGDRASFDFTGSDPAPVGVFGFARPALVAAVCDGTLHCFPDLKPLNHGITSSLQITSTPGSCVDVLEPTPVTGYASGAYEKVAAVTMACWAQAFAGVDRRRQHAATINLANLAISGRHPESGGESVVYLWNEGGQGARSYKDGNSFQLMIFIGGATNQPIEVIERIVPIRYLCCEAMPNSCGHGAFRGGLGIDRSFEATDDLVLTMHGDRAEVTPFGLAGGLNGGPNRLVLEPGTDRERSLGMDATGVRVPAGARLLYCSNGGGGFGPAHERELTLVLRDLADGLIDREVAASRYGVVVGEDGEVDADATDAARARLAGAEPELGLGPGQVHPVGSRVRLAAEE